MHKTAPPETRPKMKPELTRTSRKPRRSLNPLPPKTPLPAQSRMADSTVRANSPIPNDNEEWDWGPACIAEKSATSPKNAPRRRRLSLNQTTPSPEAEHRLSSRPEQQLPWSQEPKPTPTREKNKQRAGQRGSAML